MTTTLLPPTHLPLLLFDIDGTLLNSFDFIFGAFESTLQQFHILGRDHSDFVMAMGGPLDSCYSSLAPGHDAAELAKCHREFQTKNLHLLKPFEHTHDVLRSLQAEGYEMAAITTRSNLTSIASLRQADILQYFRLVLSFEDVEHVKPDPEPILKASRLLGRMPKDCIMIGDTYADILCAKNAGSRSVAALYGFGGEKLLELQPDAAMNDIARLPHLLETLVAASARDTI